MNEVIQINLCTNEIAARNYSAIEKELIEKYRQSNKDKLNEFKLLVQTALDKTDQVAIRAFKAGVAFNAEWAICVEKLREQMAITEWSDDLIVTQLPETYPS